MIDDQGLSFLPVNGNAGGGQGYELEAPPGSPVSLSRASISAFVELRAVRGVIIRIKKRPPVPPPAVRAGDVKSQVPQLAAVRH